MTTLEDRKLQEFAMYVNGEAVGAVSGRTHDSINPYDGEPWARVPDADEADVDKEELKYFGDKVLPLMKQAGLRH